MDKEEQYIRGFNNGYFLAEHTPELIKKLITALPSGNNYADGFFYGSQEFTIEMEQTQLNELGRLRNNGRDEQERDLS